MEEQVKSIATDHGVSGLLAGLIIVIALNVLVHVSKFVFEMVKRGNELTASKVDHLIKALDELSRSLKTFEDRVTSIERRIIEESIHSARLKIDNKRIFIALRGLAGDNWEDILKRMSTEHEFMP